MIPNNDAHLLGGVIFNPVGEETGKGLLIAHVRLGQALQEGEPAVLYQPAVNAVIRYVVRAPFFRAAGLDHDVHIVRDVGGKDLVQVLARRPHLCFQVRAAQVEENTPRVRLAHGLFLWGGTAGDKPRQQAQAEHQPHRTLFHMLHNLHPILLCK